MIDISFCIPCQREKSDAWPLDLAIYIEFAAGIISGSNITIMTWAANSFFHNI
jgi:hypothetical protein